MTMTAAFGHEDPFSILRRMTVAFVLVPGNHGDLGEVFAAGADTQPRPHTCQTGRLSGVRVRKMPWDRGPRH